MFSTILATLATPHTSPFDLQLLTVPVAFLYSKDKIGVQSTSDSQDKFRSEVGHLDHANASFWKHQRHLYYCTTK